MKMKRAKKNSDHRQRVSQSVFASPFFFFFLYFQGFFGSLSFFFFFCLPLNLSIDTIALCLFQIYAQSQPVYIYILTRNCFYIINIISAAINILTSIYYIKLSVFFII